jgi:hypothetical protein
VYDLAAAMVNEKAIDLYFEVRYLLSIVETNCEYGLRTTKLQHYAQTSPTEMQADNAITPECFSYRNAQVAEPTSTAETNIILQFC